MLDPDTKPVVVYGVSGYTGRIVCEYLREFDIPFVAAGRDAERVQELIDRVPGLDTVEHEVVEVEHTVPALTELFSGAKVVSNMVGPFVKHGPEVVDPRRGHRVSSTLMTGAARARRPSASWVGSRWWANA